MLEGYEAREKALIAVHLPSALTEDGDISAAEGECADLQLETDLVGLRLENVANSTASGEDRISAGISKVFLGARPDFIGPVGNRMVLGFRSCRWEAVGEW